MAAVKKCKKIYKILLFRAFIIFSISVHWQRSGRSPATAHWHLEAARNLIKRTKSTRVGARGRDHSALSADRRWKCIYVYFKWLTHLWGWRWIYIYLLMFAALRPKADKRKFVLVSLRKTHWERACVPGWISAVVDPRHRHTANQCGAVMIKQTRWFRLKPRGSQYSNRGCVYRGH